MRVLGAVIVGVAMLAGVSGAQGPAFIDVPPWHWSSDAVERGAAAGVFKGYPVDDRERAANAVTQVYEAFAHASHPRAREWAERFLVNLPANWAQPLERSRLASFSLENVRVEIRGDRGSVTFVAAMTQAPPGGRAALRTPMRVELRKDGEGAWRVNYADLAAGQPQIFK
ncbi:MAG: hypothetical protein ACT4PY_04010 [Armatimonadota bacterium]